MHFHVRQRSTSRRGESPASR